MDALMANGSNSEQSDNGGEQKQANHDERDICGEIPVSETLTKTTMDLPPSSRVPLPLELNCEIFKCLKLPIQKKFIWGLGRDIYGMFGQKLLKKTKRVRNPRGNRWNGANTTATVAANGLNVSTNGYPNVFAEQAFLTSGPQCRIDEFPGTICYYYEVKVENLFCYLGLSGVAIPGWLSRNSNSYAISIVGPHNCNRCCLAGETYLFELQEGAIRPKMKENGNVFGCGLVLDPDNKLSIFFTLNGHLLGQKISINPTVDRLFPAVAIAANVSIEANFGDDPAKPFEYDIHNCPGLELACI